MSLWQGRELARDYCRQCNALLSVGVNWAASHHGRKQRICTSCNSANSKQWRSENPSKQKEYAASRGKWWLESRYGLTEEQWHLMYKSQDGRCAICGSTDPKGNHNVFHVDHDHATGKVRGLLCDTCNRGLGMFYDSTSTLKSAIQYLEANNENH